MGSGRGPVAREPGEAAQPTQATCHRWPQQRATECAAPCPALHAKTWAACRQVTDGGQKCGQMHPAQRRGHHRIGVVEGNDRYKWIEWASKHNRRGNRKPQPPADRSPNGDAPQLESSPARFDDGECAADARHVGSEPAPTGS